MVSRVIHCNSCFLLARVPAHVSSPTPALYKVPKNSHFCSVISFLTVLLNPLIKIPTSCSGFMMILIPFMLLFDITI